MVITLCFWNYCVMVFFTEITIDCYYICGQFLHYPLSSTSCTLDTSPHPHLDSIFASSNPLRPLLKEAKMKSMPGWGDVFKVQ